MAMAEVVNSTSNDAEFVSNMLPSNTDNPINPHNHDLLRNPTDQLRVTNEASVSPICACTDVNKELENLAVEDEVKSRGHPMSDEKSPSHAARKKLDYTYNQSQPVPGLPPQTLFQQIENPNIRETNLIYMQANEGAASQQQRHRNFNVDVIPIPQATYRDNNRRSLHELPSNPINYHQPYRSPDSDSHRFAWVDNQPRFQRENYDSDSEILKNSVRNKKTSWDASPYGSYEKSPEFTPPFVKTHRRVRSGGETAMYGVNNSFSTYQQFHTPQLEQHRPRMMPHSQSQSNISMPHEQRLPMLLHQPISVDTSVANRDLIHQHLCLQTSTFVRLQAAITGANKEVERLEREVAAKLLELDRGLNVKQNPTHKECLHLEEEVKHLTKEIQNMYTECDTLGVATPGDSPLHPKPPRPLPGIPLPPPITSQPSKGPYENVPGVFPNKKIVSTGVPNQLSPPPIPPRIPVKPVNEHWVCPQCTFKNLLVSDCEMCLAPRPTTLR